MRWLSGRKSSPATSAPREDRQPAEQRRRLAREPALLELVDRADPAREARRERRERGRHGERDQRGEDGLGHHGCGAKDRRARADASTSRAVDIAVTTGIVGAGAAGQDTPRRRLPRAAPLSTAPRPRLPGARRRRRRASISARFRACSRPPPPPSCSRSAPPLGLPRRAAGRPPVGAAELQVRARARTTNERHDGRRARRRGERSWRSAAARPGASHEGDELAPGPHRAAPDRRRAPLRGAASSGTSTGSRCSWPRCCGPTRRATPAALRDLAREAELLARLAPPGRRARVRRRRSTAASRTSCSSTSRARRSTS